MNTPIVISLSDPYKVDGKGEMVSLISESLVIINLTGFFILN